MKKETFETMYADALEKAERERSFCGQKDVEVVLVPIVVTKKNGKISSFSGVNGELLLQENHII